MRDVPALEPWRHLADGADFVEVKVGEGAVSLREFAAALMSYQPRWLVPLWRVRTWLLRTLGQGKRQVPEYVRYTPESLPVKKGEKLSYFEVLESDARTFWFVGGSESHLEAVLGVVAEPLEDRPGTSRFYLLTVVRHHNWAGPIYLAFIKPFHHLLVHCAMNSALRPK